MERLRQFTHVCKTLFGWLAALIAVLFGGPTPMANAQFIGTVGQQSTIAPFTASATSSQVIISPCSTSSQTNCIKMIGQVAHQLTVNTVSGYPCSILLDGSNDKMNWRTIAALYILGGGANQTLTEANGFYNFIRIKINPGALFTCTGVQGVYAGFQSPLPISLLAFELTTPGPGGVAAVAKFGLNNEPIPYLITGFQCSNPNGSTAFLQLFDSATTPTLGTGPIYQIGIPAGGVFSYEGLPFSGYTIFWAGASTAFSGSVAVADPLTCNFQTSYTGPFAPFTPTSP